MAILHRTVYLPVAPCRWFFFIIAATWCVSVVVYMSMFRPRGLDTNVTPPDTIHKASGIACVASVPVGETLVPCSLL